MSYTVGNWTVESLTTDSISSPKSLSLPDLDYANDYHVVQQRPTEIRLANNTSNGLLPMEVLRYGRQAENNVYAGFDVSAAQQLNVRDGIVLTCEVKYLLKATNTVSGAEALLPMRGWINLKVPTVDLVSTSALTELLNRTCAAALGTGQTDGSLVANMARGDLDPTV